MELEMSFALIILWITSSGDLYNLVCQVHVIRVCRDKNGNFIFTNINVSEVGEMRFEVPLIPSNKLRTMAGFFGEQGRTIICIPFPKSSAVQGRLTADIL